MLAQCALIVEHVALETWIILEYLLQRLAHGRPGYLGRGAIDVTSQVFSENDLGHGNVSLIYAVTDRWKSGKLVILTWTNPRWASRCYREMSISLSQAEAVVEGALAKARELGLPPLSIAVLDSGGHLKAMQRQDGVAFLRAAICEAKAWGALALGASSRHFAERYASDTLQRGFMNALGGNTRERIVPLPGGVLIRDGDGRLLGAVGVAGAASEDDEACAVAGIEVCGLVADLDSRR